MYRHTHVITTRKYVVTVIELKFGERNLHIFSPRGREKSYYESSYKNIENIEIFTCLDTHNRFKFNVTHVKEQVDIRIYIGLFVCKNLSSHTLTNVGRET
jgi:hypothetical protein